MTKIIQSGFFHGFHFLLIASPALGGHSLRSRAGQGRCRLHLHNGLYSRQDYQRRHIHTLRACEANNLALTPGPAAHQTLAPWCMLFGVCACMHAKLLCDSSGASLFSISLMHFFCLTELQVFQYFFFILNFGPSFCFVGPLFEWIV